LFFPRAPRQSNRPAPSRSGSWKRHVPLPSANSALGCTAPMVRPFPFRTRVMAFTSLSVEKRLLPPLLLGLPKRPGGLARFWARATPLLGTRALASPSCRGSASNAGPHPLAAANPKRCPPATCCEKDAGLRRLGRALQRAANCNAAQVRQRSSRTSRLNCPTCSTFGPVLICPAGKLKTCDIILFRGIANHAWRCWHSSDQPSGRTASTEKRFLPSGATALRRSLSMKASPLS